jgi:hypothetical protein
VSSHETLGLILVREGLITRPQLYDALRLQRQNNRLLGTCLLSLGYVEADRLLAILAKQLAVPALPRGLLIRASQEAVRRVPAEVAHRLRIVPYSWDGEMLGVAVADGRVLNHLHEVALHAKAAIGAYVALETEIEETLGKLYPGTKGAATPPPLAGRARPPTLSVAQAPASTAPQRRATVATPPSFPAVEKCTLYEAVERIYEAETVRSVGRAVAQALLNYFARVVVFERLNTNFKVVAYGGVTPSRTDGALEDLPQVTATAKDKGLAHGLATNDPRATELARYFGLGRATTFLLAPIAPDHSHALVAYGDNGDLEETYDDLHELEMLVKEADTALHLLET